MKRSRESEEFVDWNEVYVIEVFKIVAYYGFDTMDDIAMFCSIKKSFYDWAERYVFERCLTITTAIQEKYTDYNVFKFKRFFPRKSLLICKNQIILNCVSFIRPIKKECLYHVSLIVIVNNEPIYNCCIGRNGLSYKTFNFNDYYVVPGAKFDLNGKLFRKIRFTVTLKK